MSKSNHMCRLLWLSTTIKSLRSSSLVLTTSQLVWVPLHIRLSSVFHVSQLKKAVSALHLVTAVPSSDDVLWSVPERVL